jgi:hypothetical protein
MFFVHFLRFLVFFQAVSGLLGGLLMILDPSGGILKLPPELLQGTPFGNYLIPGLVLFLLLGIYPMLVFFALIRDPDRRIFQKINIWKRYMSGWTAAVYTGVMLVGWIIIQLLLIGYQSYLQPAYLIIGIAILILSSSSPVKQYYLKTDSVSER